MPDDFSVSTSWGNLGAGTELVGNSDGFPIKGPGIFRLKVYGLAVFGATPNYASAAVNTIQMGPVNPASSLSKVQVNDVTTKRLPLS